jgi:hypothetical protein
MAVIVGAFINLPLAEAEAVLEVATEVVRDRRASKPGPALVAKANKSVTAATASIKPPTQAASGTSTGATPAKKSHHKKKAAPAVAADQHTSGGNTPESDSPLNTEGLDPELAAAISGSV